MQLRKETGYIFSILGGICWALAGVFGQYLFQFHQISPEWLVPIRLLCAGIILIVVCKIRRRKVFSVWKEKKDIKDVIIFAIFGAALCQYSYFSAVATSNAATATFICYTSPIFIIIFIALKTRRRPVLYEIVSVCLVVAGIFVVATHGNIHSLYISGESLFWGILAAVTFAIYSIQPQRLMRKFDTLLITAWGMLIGGSMLFVVFRPWNLHGLSNMYAYMAMGIIVLFGTILSYTFFLEGIKRIGATKGSLLSSIEPLVATILSVVWLNETFQIIDLLGFALILSTVIVIARTPSHGSEVQTQTFGNDT
ncbi:DMT family transporter [Paenibacillus terrae]